MKQIKTARENIIVVEVPSNSFGYDIQNYTTKQELIYMIDLDDLDVEECTGDETLITKELPLAKDYKILGKIDHGVIDFDCSEFCYSHNDLGKTWYQDYTKYLGGGWFLNKNDSFLSLLRSHGIDPSKGKFVVLLINSQTKSS